GRSSGEGLARHSEWDMDRKNQPVASPPKRRAGQATGSVPPDNRVKRPAHGKRKANRTIAHAGLRAAATASATASSKTGRRSGAAGGNATRNNRLDPATETRNKTIRSPVPGDRVRGSSDRRSIAAAPSLTGPPGSPTHNSQLTTHN